MPGKSQLLSRFLALTLSMALIAPISAPILLFPTEVAAKTPKKSALPKPYVSKALRAVLMPVTKAVARKFKLAKGAKGVMVVSVKPDGIGKLAGLKPGDVISTVLGRKVTKPSDVDTIIAYFLAGGLTDYKIGGTRKNGRTYRAETYITPTYFYDPIDVYTLTTWNSFTYETYSYSEYVTYYSEEIYTSYERSETYIQETITETSFVSEMTTETSYEYASYDEEVVDGSYVEGGTGTVWQDGETEVVYDPADDPALLEVPSDSAADDADPFTADLGEPEYDSAGVDAATEDTALYDDAASTEDPTFSEDPMSIDEGASADESAPTEDYAPPEDAGLTEDPATDDSTYVEDAPAVDDGTYTDDATATEDTSAYDDTAPVEDNSTYEDPPMEDDSAAYEDPAPAEDASAYEDAAPAEDTTAYEDPAPQDESYSEPPADEGSYDTSCPGEVIDGACVDSSSGAEDYAPEE